MYIHAHTDILIYIRRGHQHTSICAARRSHHRAGPHINYIIYICPYIYIYIYNIMYIHAYRHMCTYILRGHQHASVCTTRRTVQVHIYIYIYNIMYIHAYTHLYSTRPSTRFGLRSAPPPLPCRPAY